MGAGSDRLCHHGCGCGPGGSDRDELEKDFPVSLPKGSADSAL